MTVIESRVVNIDELKLERFAQGDKFGSDCVRIGPLIGAKNPMFFIVKGNATLRYGEETRKIRAGDVICCPTGGPETAHQIINDSDAELAYLSVSARMSVDVVEYPDSGKIGAYGGGLRHMTRAGDHLDYWTDEA